MEKKELSRHTFVFLNSQGKERLLQEFIPLYEGAALERMKSVFSGNADVPGIVRRAEEHEQQLALGFVPCRRMPEGERLRIPAYVNVEEIREVCSVYDAAKKNITIRNRCMDAACYARHIAADLHVRMGILGSAGLEIITGLPYTDDASDLDILVEADSSDKLKKFSDMMQKMYPGMDMDFEVELPNGFGVKLAELFMDTRTLVGKSLNDVVLLQRNQVNELLKERA